MNLLPLRLPPGVDLRATLAAVLEHHGVRAAFVVAGIGSLGPACLRFAGAQAATRLDGDCEILTLSGSLATNGVHLHASVSDAHGRVYGGHVAAGCVVRTTAEVLVQLLPDHAFTRAFDAATGYAELHVDRREPPGDV